MKSRRQGERWDVEVRPASTGEIDQMSCWVLWMYDRGQPVALWKRSGRISLLPDRIPSDEVVCLRKSRADFREGRDPKISQTVTDQGS